MAATPTTNIAFLTVPNLVTCSEVTIQWTYNSTTSPTSNYSLVVTNIGINQSGLNRRTYPLVSRQSTAVVNTTLASINATAGKFDWTKVNIPQGWYRMNIYATAEVVPSNIFNVTNGLDVSCVVTPLQSTTPPSSSTSPIAPDSSQPPYTTLSTNNPSVTTSALDVGNSSAKKRAIAGGVVGGVAVLALIAAVALWLSRQRKARARGAVPPATRPRGKGQPSKGNHNPSDSTGAILPFGVGNRGNSRRLSTSDEDFASEKSAVVDEESMPKLPLPAATRLHPDSTTNRRPTSMMVKPSFESYESTQSRPSTSPAHSRYPPDRTRRASRKPVPAYDPNEFPGNESNDTPISDRPESFLGGGTKVYYIIPDAPLEQRG